MIKVLISQNKGREKTNIRGFWYSQENKKIYYDYLKLQRGVYCELEWYKNKLRQEALFYVKDSIGYIYYNKDKIEKLNHRIYEEVKDLKREIKEALKKYNGVTIYKENNKYFKEIYY